MVLFDARSNGAGVIIKLGGAYVRREGLRNGFLGLVRDSRMWTCYQWAPKGEMVRKDLSPHDGTVPGPD
ncbi:hypothetical protein DES53_102937 [Roseimicrobium gellanilyticum]|uniref:Uncharacterized protein n=1 Tax=Roseimicrobium gellanilyticum TaxID=748857 RepID=A0A366HSR8_9BACT|nr:hypothetical protein DES53_102937 [Roseimicrobium gellanilyticum]